MKKAITTISSFAAASALALAFTACEVEQTEEGKMPEVDVNVEEGNLPKYDVDAPEVDVEMKEKEVLVPKVGLEEETIKVPDVDVTPAGEAKTPDDAE